MLILVRATKEFWSDSLFKCIEALCQHLSLSGWKKYHLPIWESNFVDLCLFLLLTGLHTGATFMEILPGTASKIRYGYGQNFVACRMTIFAYQSIAGLVRIIRCTCELLNCRLEMCLLIRAMSQKSFGFGDKYHITWRRWSELKYLQRRHVNVFM